MVHFLIKNSVFLTKDWQICFQPQQVWNWFLQFMVETESRDELNIFDPRSVQRQQLFNPWRFRLPTLEGGKTKKSHQGTLSQLSQ